VHCQGFNNAFFWGGQMVAAAALGVYLDRANGSVRTRAVRACGVTAVLGAAAWAAVLHVHGKERLDDDSRQV
jgi:hypothetical protein